MDRLFTEINTAQPVNIIDLPDMASVGECYLSLRRRRNETHNAYLSIITIGQRGCGADGGTDGLLNCCIYGYGYGGGGGGNHYLGEKEIINRAADMLRLEFPNMFSPSIACRIPNINVDNLRDEVSSSSSSSSSSNNSNESG